MKNIHSGFYLYNNNIYFNREDALEEMLINNDFESTMSFYYNDNVFNKIDWSIEPDIDISRLYKLRAQQIRDKYNRVIIAFSGGSDSTQVLMSFLKNNIFIDEIHVHTVEKMMNRFDKQILVNDQDLGVLMEYEYAVKPMLKYVKEKSPNTKIIINDVSDYLYDQLSNNKFIPLTESIVSHRINSGLNTTFGWHYFHEKISENDKNKSCLVRGYEKPVLFIENGNQLYFKFFDITTGISSTLYKSKIIKSYEYSYVYEDFFWSPDMPFIPIKQSHMILNRFKSDSAFLTNYINYKKELDVDSSKKNAHSNSLLQNKERMICEVIYPDWNPNTFAGSKPIEKSAEFKIYEMAVGKHQGENLKAELRAFKEKKYEKIANKLQFYKPIFSRKYYIGEI